MSYFNIILPAELKVVTENERTGSYEIEGLYPGYGHTLGNSLRRIILSSLPGAAVTAIKIEGASHEFSTLAGVKEDVITIILNLKQIRFRMTTDEPQTATIEIKGNQVVTGGDISVPGTLEVLNPDFEICTVTDKKLTFKVTMTVEKGLGYVSKERLHKDKVDIGTIVVDAIFTPIRKVNYEVENMRVGERTDFNRLRINIETDGTITPKEALERAIKIMLEQLRTILNLKEEAVVRRPVEIVAPAAEPSATENVEGDSSDLTDVLKTRIDSLDLSTRTANALSAANIRTLGGLVRKAEQDLLGLEGIGSKGIDEIKRVLEDHSLALKS